MAKPTLFRNEDGTYTAITFNETVIRQYTQVQGLELIRLNRCPLELKEKLMKSKEPGPIRL
jgi:hypothetical protein